MLDADDIVIDRICNGLMNREDIWWSRLICPGPWESVSGADASDFVKQWIAADRRWHRPPFAVLYPPLGLLRSKFEFAQLTLWQVAVDLRFNVGVVDLIERPGFRLSSSQLHLLPDPVANLEDFEDQPELTVPKSKKVAHTEGPPTDAAVSESNDEPENRVLESLLELIDIDLSGLKKANDLGPNDIKRRLTRDDMVLNRTEDAVRWTTLLLSLSRRRAGRSCVINPEEPLTALPNGPCNLQFDLSSVPLKTAEAVQVDAGWCVQCDVWLGAAIYRVSATVRTDGDVQINRTQRLADAPENPPEMQVGPVRLFNHTGKKISA